MASKGIALVTGASRGIGRSIALRLAVDGYDVAINDVSAAEESLAAVRREIIDKGRRSLVLIADVSIDSEVEGSVRSVVENMGGLDVMVANAGIFLAAKPIVETTLENWEKTFYVNARGVFLSHKYAARQMIAQCRGGRIIGASSVLGKQGDSLLGAYSASKFAVRGLTQTAALELGKHGTTVNAYAPGAIEAPMLKELAEATSSVKAMYDTEMGRNSVGYLGMPSDIASIVSYLASKEAHFITGQSISVNSGRYFD